MVVDDIGLLLRRLNNGVTALIHHSLLIQSLDSLLTLAAFHDLLFQCIFFLSHSLGLLKNCCRSSLKLLSNSLTSSISCLVLFLLEESFIMSADLPLEAI